LLGPALLHAGTRPYVIALGAVVTALLGAGAGWFGWSSAGFVLLSLAWLVHRVAGLLARVERDSLIAMSGLTPLDRLAEWILDGMFVALCAWRSEIPKVPGVPWGIAWFPPLVLFLLLRLFHRMQAEETWTWWLSDRLLVGGALAFTSTFLPFDFVERALVIALLAAGLILADRGVEPKQGLPR